MALFKPGEGGRPKGAQNKLTTQARDAFQMAFDAVGGVKRLSEWANENLEEFYKIYSKLIPVSLDVDVNVVPKAVVRPMGEIIEQKGSGLPLTSEAMDSVH